MNKVNIIVIFNLHLLINNINYSILKTFINNNPSKIILFTSNKPINLFCNIRVPTLSNHELLKISLYINNYYKLNLPVSDLQLIINSTDYNLNNLYNLLQQKLLNISYDPIVDIFNIIKLNNINDVPSIKKIINNIYLTNYLPISLIFNKFIKLFIKNTDIKININILINIASDLEHKSLNNNKDFLFLEIFIINIYNLLND